MVWEVTVLDEMLRGVRIHIEWDRRLSQGAFGLWGFCGNAEARKCAWEGGRNEDMSQQNEKQVFSNLIEKLPSKSGNGDIGFGSTELFGELSKSHTEMGRMLR